MQPVLHLQPLPGQVMHRVQIHKNEVVWWIHLKFVDRPHAVPLSWLGVLLPIASGLHLHRIFQHRL